MFPRKIIDTFNLFFLVLLSYNVKKKVSTFFFPGLLVVAVLKPHEQKQPGEEIVYYILQVTAKQGGKTA